MQDCTAQLPGAHQARLLPERAGYARDYLAHEVALDEGSRLRELFGAREVQVNSMHHQGISRLGSGLRVDARAARTG